MKDKGELQALKTELSRGGRQVMLLSETDSTNRVAKAWAMENPGRRAVVMADRQTAGRGRLGRKWCSAEGNLYISFVYEAPLPPEQLSALTLAGDMLAHVHTANAIGRKYPAPGDGENYEGIFEALIEGGYDARVSIEGGCTDFSAEARAAFEVLTQARDAAYAKK